jgi:hypothetical protein
MVQILIQAFLSWARIESEIMSDSSAFSLLFFSFHTIPSQFLEKIPQIDEPIRRRLFQWSENGGNNHAKGPISRF